MPRWRLTVLALVAGLAAVAAAYAAARMQRPATPAAVLDAPPPTGFRGAVRPPGIPVRDFALLDQDGRLVSTRALRGTPVVLTFVYSHCHDTCPIMLQQIRGALDDLRRPVPVLAVSVDPARDTRASARAFLRRQRMARRVHYLLGTRAQLARVWKAFYVQPQGREVEHSASTVLLDARGRQRVGFFASILTPEGLAADLRRLGAR